MKAKTNHAKKVLALLFAALMPLVANAQTKVEIDGIWYNLTAETSEAEVTFKGDSFDSYWDECFGSITIPATVTYEDVTYSVTSIGGSAFDGCGSFTSVTIPEGVTSIGDRAFYNCSSLTSITLSENSQLKSIGKDAFSNCSSLTSITIPEGVLSIGRGAFSGCSSLTSITIPENSQLKRIESGAFSYCSSLTSITIPESVTYIGSYAFHNCSSLTSITLSEGVTSIREQTFRDCSSLTSITIPEGVTNIGEWAFSGCSSLTSITIPEGVTSIGRSAFSGCSSLTSITIPGNSQLTSIGSSAFSGCSSLTSITIPEGVTSIGKDAFSGCSGELTVNCNIPSASSYYYSGGAFYSSEFTTVTIGEGVTSIGDYAFYGCSSLNSITIPGNSQLMSIGRSAFSGCSSLTSITIPEGVTSIGEDAFSGCSGELTVNCNIPSASSYSNGAFYNSEFTTVTIGEGVTSIGDKAFSDCRSLTSITIPGNSQLTSIGSSAFSGCSSLASITLPENSQLTSIGYRAFSDCRSLTSITLPESVTSIGGSAFSACSSLTSITIPEGVTYIGSYAFSNCPELTDVYSCAEKVPSTNTNIFDGSNIEYATLHVPASAVNEYKNTAPWSGFGKFETTSIAVASITLSASSAALAEGESLTLTATVSPDDAEDKSISWSSSAPNVATVDNAGKVTAIAPGTAIITATANDGSGVSASCKVTVSLTSYVVTYLVDGEVYAAETLSRGATIVAPDAPTKEGHTFSGWSGLPETMPAKDISVSATFTVNKYQVTFKIDGVVIATYTQDYGSTVVAPDAPEREGYTFSGWGDVAETVPASDIAYEGTFIVNKYLVTFKIGDEVIAADLLEYGTKIIAPEAPEKEGYTFNGWGEIAKTVPAHDLTYKGNYSINSYTLTYVVDGEVVLTLPIVYGATIPVLKVPVKEGYEFSGWSEIPETMPAGDVTVTGTFKRLPSVYLTINQSDNGCVKQHLVVGAVCSYTIEAAEGWKIHTVTFNGEDVTSQLTEEGTFTTPALSEDATLNISYEKIDDAIESTRADAVKVRGHQGTISITGATEGDVIGLYAASGTLVATATAEGDTTHLTVPTGQVYIVKVADTVVKIGM